MKSTKKNETVTKTDGSIANDNKYWNEESLNRFREYQTAYIAKSYRTFMFRVRKDTEKNLIDFCENQDNLTGFVVSLIKDEMIKQGAMSNDNFSSDHKYKLEVLVKFYISNKRISVADYITPELKMIAGKKKKVSYTIVSSDVESITVSVKFSPDNSMNNAIKDAARNLESDIRENCGKMLAQFGINPEGKILKKKYHIVSEDSVAIVSTDTDKK